MRKILLTGSTGQIGWELQRTLLPLGEVIPVSRNAPIPLLQLDLAAPQRLCQLIREIQPDLIVNAAAYTAVDKAETEPELAQAVNGTAPGIIAEEAKRIGAAIVHYSTDYVFDGIQTRPYRENDPTNPLNIYGKTKLAGEQAILAVAVPHLILRTSWVYGMRGNNFLSTILRLSQEREELKVVDDQIGAPTWSRAIAEATAQILAQGTGELDHFLAAQGGLYHLTAGGQTSWYGFAESILQHCSIKHQKKLKQLLPIPTTGYPTPAQRPAFSLLDNHKVFQTFGLQLPEWQKAMALLFQ